MRKCFGFLTIAWLGGCGPAFGGLIYTCDPSIDAPTCAALNGSSPGVYNVAGIYDSIFSGSLSANIYITYGITGVGESSTNYTSVPYTDYFNALAAHTDDPVALASLGLSGDPLGSQSNGQVAISPALATALGITDNGANTAGLEADGTTNCALGTAGCYNGVITISNGGGFYFPSSPGAAPPSPPAALVDFYSVVEHETDEVLGTVSCIGDFVGAPYDQCNPGYTDASAADLFRYSAAGIRSFLDADEGTSAYFSIDGGMTDIADYNNSPNGQDYGDWLAIYPYLVQDGEASPDVTLDISTDVGVNSDLYPRPEVAVLDAVGFDLATAVPEPATFGLVGVGFVCLGLAGLRKGAASMRRPADHRETLLLIRPSRYFPPSPDSPCFHSHSVRSPLRVPVGGPSFIGRVLPSGCS